MKRKNSSNEELRQLMYLRLAKMVEIGELLDEIKEETGKVYKESKKLKKTVSSTRKELAWI